MRVPTFGISVLAGALSRIAVGAMPFLLPMMLQIGFGMSASESGLVTFASAVGSLAMRLAARPLLHRIGFRNTLVWVGLISTVLLGSTAAFRPGWPLVAIYAVLLFGGFFQSLQFMAYNTIAYADIPRPRMSSATSFYTTFQQLCISLGIATAAAALAGSMFVAGHPVPHLSDFTRLPDRGRHRGMGAAPVVADGPQRGSRVERAKSQEGKHVTLRGTRVALALIACFCRHAPARLTRPSRTRSTPPSTPASQRRPGRARPAWSNAPATRFAPGMDVSTKSTRGGSSIGPEVCRPSSSVAAAVGGVPRRRTCGAGWTVGATTAATSFASRHWTRSCPQSGSWSRSCGFTPPVVNDRPDRRRDARAVSHPEAHGEMLDQFDTSEPTLAEAGERFKRVVKSPATLGHPLQHGGDAHASHRRQEMGLKRRADVRIGRMAGCTMPGVMSDGMEPGMAFRPDRQGKSRSAREAD